MVKVNQEKLKAFWAGADAFDKECVRLALWYVQRGTDDVYDPLVREAIRLLYELGILEEAASEEV